MTETAAASHVHRFVPATAPGNPPLLLLHGTGGDENDLLPFGAAAAPGSALLSPRGNVLEGGMNRFFRRISEGVFDEQDVMFRAIELADFTAEMVRTYGIGKPVALGFSNGANIAAAMLFIRPDALAGAVLLRPMPPFAVPPEGTLAATPVLILSGAMDGIAPVSEAHRLAESLAARGAVVRSEALPAAHGLTQFDLSLVKAWIAELAPGVA